MRENAGYKIITALLVGKADKRMEELVIGYNPNAADPWVCWYCYDGTDYCHGDYCKTSRQALAALSERVKRNLTFYDFGNLEG